MCIFCSAKVGISLVVCKSRWENTNKFHLSTRRVEKMTISLKLLLSKQHSLIKKCIFRISDKVPLGELYRLLYNRRLLICMSIIPYRYSQLCHTPCINCAYVSMISLMCQIDWFRKGVKIGQNVLMILKSYYWYRRANILCWEKIIFSIPTRFSELFIVTRYLSING